MTDLTSLDRISMTRSMGFACRSGRTITRRASCNLTAAELYRTVARNHFDIKAHDLL